MVREKLGTLIHSNYFIPLCIASSIIVRVFWICLIPVEPVSDFNFYFQRGLDIANGAGYSSDGIPTAYWPVGYPAFLGILFLIFGHSLFYAKLANVFIYAGIIILAYSLSKRMLRNEYAAKITIIILAFYPNHIAYTSLMASETIFTFMLLLGAISFISARGRYGLLIISGLSWGLATLIKSQAIFIPAVFLLVYYKNIKSLIKSGVIVFLMLFLTIAPWVNRNNSVFGKRVLATNGGINLLIGNSRYSDGSYAWNQELESSLGDADNEADRDTKALQLAKDYMINNPVKTILLWPRKIFYLYAADIEGFYWNQAGMLKSDNNIKKYAFLLMKIVAQLYYMFTIGLFFAALPRVLHNGRHSHIGLYFILYFTFVSLIFFGTPRFHFPLIPWVAIYSGIKGAIILKGRFPPRIAVADSP